MDFGMSSIQMYEVSWCKYNRTLMDDFCQRNRGTAGRETDYFSEASMHQVHHKRASVPCLESGPAQVHIVNFDSVLNILRHTLNQLLTRQQLMKGSVNQVHAQDANSLLLEEVGRIPQVDMQQYVVGLPTNLLLKAQTKPTVRFIGSRVVSRGDGIDEREEASL